MGSTVQTTLGIVMTLLKIIAENSEMLIALTSIWTQVAGSIYYDDNRYANHTSLIWDVDILRSLKEFTILTMYCEKKE